jgi:sodium/bile acid cotransporter 7
MMTKNAGGNESAALINALLGNILGILISPALIWLFMLNADINALHQPYDAHDYLHVLLNLSLTVLLPLIVGQIIHSLWTEKIMWAKTKFYFAELSSISLLILIWSIFCDLFQSGLLETVNKVDFIILALLNASLYIIFSLLAMFFARLPNIFICQTRTTTKDKQPLLLDDHQKQKTLIERWRFSREDTIAIMFCSATKTVVKGVSLINTVNSTNNQDLIGLFSLPLIVYYVEQQILGAFEVILLQHWLKSKHDTNRTDLVEK